MKPHASGKFGTDAATLAIFDPLCLARRADDDCDWWSDPTEELAEINAGNVMFAALGSDGVYDFDVYSIREGETMPEVRCRALIRTRMGSVYIGAGEEVVGEGIGPTTQYGGLLYSLPSGSYVVGLDLDETTSKISIYFESTEAEARNEFTDSPSIHA